MELELQRPEGVDDDAWKSIEEAVARLRRALDDSDSPLVIGSAKELLETAARVILDARGETVASNVPLPTVLSRAHLAIDRQPGHGLAQDDAVRNIAQGAKTIASQLPELRNRYGTGHGRVALPDIGEELVRVSVDAVMLWCRWALPRLEQLLAGSVPALARDLREGKAFRRADLAARMEAANLPNQPPEDQHLLGVAIAQRAMRDTVVVMEAVEACANARDLDAWPPRYREGLVEGVFLDRDGYVDAKEWGVGQVAFILAPLLDPASAIAALKDKIREAGLSVRFTPSTARRKVAEKMREVAVVLPSGDARRAWNELADMLAEWPESGE